MKPLIVEPLIFVAALTLILGQTAEPLGLSEWIGGAANLSAVGLLGYLLYWQLTKESPRQHDLAREHTEKVIEKIVEANDRRADQEIGERRRDREQWAAEMSKCQLRNEP